MIRNQPPCMGEAPRSALGGVNRLLYVYQIVTF
jgi:hypothetical protein